jgi:hypothetical protein
MYTNIHIYIYVYTHICMSLYICILIYTVTSNVKQCGAGDALDRLKAVQYTQAKNRQFQSNDSNDVFSLVGNLDDVPLLSELEAVKRAIATVYLALPLGSIQMHKDGDSDGGDVYMAITEPNGWNDMIDQVRYIYMHSFPFYPI